MRVELRLGQASERGQFPSASCTTPRPQQHELRTGELASILWFLSTLAAASPTVPTLFEKSVPACAVSGKAGGFLALDRSDPTVPDLLTLAHASCPIHGDLATAFSIYLPPSPSLPAPIAPPAPPFLGCPLCFYSAAARARNHRHHHVVIRELERMVVREGRVLGVEVKGCGVVDTDVVVLALGPCSRQFDFVKEVFDVPRLPENQ
ncbi:uncharacterized protein LOC124662347 [Lolium rigidum]|uniref:uncharacterized protein LOC124662347 n=1 Tax=Lolium rigidum TaxID=89674 RepID=UPI001F5E17EE|nr:uncharacterized protein LOC124662347 [Lolium rigidum]